MKSVIRIVLAFSITVLGIVSGQAQTVTEEFNVLKTLEARINIAVSEFTIHFNLPVNYLGHSPTKEGKHIIIRVAPIGRNPRDVTGFTSSTALNNPMSFGGREVLSWTATKELPLTEVEYEGTNIGGPIIEVSFTRSVKYKVVPSKDLRSLTILVENEKQAKSTSKHNYLLNLSTSGKPFDVTSLDTGKFPENYVFFPTHSVVDNKSVNHLKVGFFKTPRDIREALKKLKPYYPDAKVMLSTDEDIKVAKQYQRDQKLIAKTTPLKTPAPGKESPAIASNSRDIMEKAKFTLLEGNYDKAIEQYTVVIQKDPNGQYAQEAQEYLGLTRQRNNQVAHAIAEYKKYLQKYPQGEGATRVKQRLNSLLTASHDPRGKLPGTTTEDKKSPWRLYGNVYGNIRYDNSKTVIKATNTKIKNQTTTYVTSLNATARKRTEKSETKIRFTGIYRDADDGTNRNNRSGRVNYFYVDHKDKVRNYGYRIGRQAKSSGGVLGRFDGISVDYKISSRYKVNFVSGYPVNFTKFGQIETNRYFYGVNTDISTKNKYLTFNVFAINQVIDGISDRESIGGEVRYMNPKHSLFALVDYDHSYQELNTVFVSNNWRFKNKAVVNVTYDYRRSPVLTTSNALQGQTEGSIKELLRRLSESQIRQLARDRTATYKSVSVGGTYPLAHDLYLNGNVTVAELEGTVASGNVAAVPDSSQEYFYSLQLIKNSWLKAGDVSIFGIQFADATTYQRTSYSYGIRYPLTPRIRIRPKFEYDVQDINDGTEVTTYRPSLRVDYRASNRWRWELESGYSYAEIRNSASDSDQTDYFISMGFIYDF